ncbi:MAG: hypothetical protein ABH864_00935 [archaeon]
MVTKKDFVGMILVGLILVASVWFFQPVLALDPTGASVTDVRTETAPADTAGNDSALAGNISELTITAYTTTQTWQGYIGNISGVIQLADGDDDVLYNWSLADPEGEIYATTNASVNWSLMNLLIPSLLPTGFWAILLGLKLESCVNNMRL